MSHYNRVRLQLIPRPAPDFDKSVEWIKSTRAQRGAVRADAALLAFGAGVILAIASMPWYGATLSLWWRHATALWSG